MKLQNNAYKMEEINQEEIEVLEAQRYAKWEVGVKHIKYPDWTIFPITGIILGKKGIKIGSLSSGYTGAVYEGKKIRFHRAIFEAAYNVELVKSEDSKLTEFINHIDHIKSNNKITNLEILNNQQNTQWTLDKESVHWETARNIWRCELKYNYFSYYLGRFHNKVDGQKVYNDYALYLNNTYNCKYCLHDIPDYIAIARNVPADNKLLTKLKKTSKYTGVSYVKRGKTVSYNVVINHDESLGSYKTEDEAGKAWNQQAMYNNNHKNENNILNIIPGYINFEKDVYSELRERIRVKKIGKFIGVRKWRNLWRAFYAKNSTQIGIGNFDTKLEAAIGYNEHMTEFNKTSNRQYKINDLTDFVIEDEE